MIYVEARVRADLDALWEHTQNPALHQRWDLRFSEIGPAGAEGHFEYVVRFAGLRLSGTGISAGERHRPDGTRTSALRFSCDHPLSVIREGSGWWRYVPTIKGIRFLTGYDYQPRSRIADLVFRPALGWATAWSFDRLRLWLETGQSPERSLWQSLAELAVRAGAVIVAAVVAPPAVLGVVVVIALWAPPLPGTPAARRCLRRSPDRRARP
jgi:hypothetical protein